MRGQIAHELVAARLSECKRTVRLFARVEVRDALLVASYLDHEVVLPPGSVDEVERERAGRNVNLLRIEGKVTHLHRGNGRLRLRMTGTGERQRQRGCGQECAENQEAQAMPG